MASQSFDEPLQFADMRDKVDARSLLLGAFFLFFLFLFTFIFVYFLYICTQRRQPATAGSGGRASFAHPSPPPSASSRSPLGLDPAALSALPTVAYESRIQNEFKKRSQEAADCSICLSRFQEGDKLKVLPLCRHGFHSECVDKWLRTRSSCPLCRSSVLLRADSEIP